ncbi:outer membrane beta-barrel family protein [Massilibacteroides sp.]|uniref:outer membrane beta-barrel family protein n=1 Tax=Massilibacteroides sp. TaxID=2034766 RepID=UPI00260C416A|nr:outer membrane beta-barrel family protein [Massilibacteroides sp.]MDD4516526.1 outer membrane beta-barrel family protein [Massilibacteroides sp.]
MRNFNSKYSFDFNEQWAVDIGARTEYTVSTIDVPNESNEVSKSKYLNFVPMFQSVYRFDEKNNFIFNYGMRISRPGLTYLNPYIDDSDPTNIYFGNPDLNIVRRDLVTLSYNHLRSKFDLYARLNYSITNNSIQPYLYYANEILNNTYMNFGKQQESGLLLYANWTPDDMLRLSLKGTIAYVDIESKQEDVLKRAGFSNRISGNIAYKLPSDFYISVSGGYYQPSIQLQTKGDPYYYSRISVSKNWLDDKLSLALSISNPISSKTKFQYLTETPDVYRQDIDYRLDQKLKDKTCVSFW